jgi:peptidoglycan/xylan/chitin deacetylase (PgdA/CDA1 family)
VGIVAATVLTTGLITELVPGLTIDVPTLTPTPTAAVVLLLPTPTPSPTLTIGEALAQPVASSGGLAGIVAAVTATAVAPTVAPAPAEVAIEVTVTDAAASGLQGEGEAAPQPTLLPQPTADSTVRTVRVPILMYHYLSVPPADADIYRRDLSVTPDLFAAHLDAMQGAGYTPISLYALIDHLTQGAPLPAKPVVLTFDDGYRDNYENAFPRLRDRGMTATFFIVTDFIDGQRPEYLTWEMVREMYAGGMSIEAHGRNHVSLKNKDQDYLIWQALGSLETIQFELGVRPHFVSYPAGEYDQATIDIFRSANYWAGFTTIQGATHSSDDLFQLRRVRVRGTTEPAELLRLLALDW